MYAPNQILSGMKESKKTWPTMRIIKNWNEPKIDRY